MAATKIAAYIIIRRGSYEQWGASNPILKEGEGGLVSSGSQDIGKIKFGDGITSWNNLSYTIGADGIPATFEDPIIDIVEPGTPGSIVNEGSENDAKFHFYIPRGYPGITVPDITGLDEASSIDFDNDLMFVYSAADGIMRKWSPSIIKPIDYSNDEKIMPQKWVNGETIYRKVYVDVPFAVTAAVGTNTLTLDSFPGEYRIIDVVPTIFVPSDQRSYLLPNVGATGNIVFFYRDWTNNTLAVDYRKVTATVSQTMSVSLVIEYIKGSI